MATKAIEDVYPLTPLQEGMLYHAILTPGDGAYHDQFSAVLRGPLDPDRLVAAWQAMARGHAVFRTAFAWKTGQAPLQVVGRRVETPVVRLDWRDAARDEAEQLRRREALIRDDATQGFDPGKAPLTRLTLARLADDAWFLLWSRHHLLLDGWSVAHVLREWLAAYAALGEGRPVVPTTARPFRDYLAWLKQQDGARAEAYWRNELGDLEQPTTLGLALPPDAVKPSEGERHGELTLKLTANESAALRALARSAEVTLATVLQGAWALLLARWGGERDIVFGHTVAGRPADLPQVETMVGLFINTLPLRARIDPGMELGTWLRALQARVATAREFEHTPLVKIQGWTQVPRDRALFETLLVYENYPVDEALAGGLGDLRVEDAHSHERTHYAATMIVAPGDRLTLLMLHDRSRLTDALARRWLGYFRALLAALARGATQPLGLLHGMTAADTELVVQRWNQTARDHARSETLASLFAAQAARSPEAVALVDGEQRWTYAQVAQRAAAVATELGALGAGPECCVGVCLERGADLIAALLGVLECGAAYVPLDPTYPAERLGFMFGDAQLVALVSHRAAAKALPPHDVPTVWLDDLAVSPTTACGRGPAVPANLAYLIYTSGSTGRPKATAIEHRQAVALVHWAQEAFTREELAGVLFSTSVCFDLSVFELFVTLASGGTVIIAENALALPTLPARDEVTLINTVPSAAAELARQEAVPASVRTINLAGEPLSAALADRLYSFSGVEKVQDLYGPSEDTTYSTHARREPAGPATIGRVIANSRLYLVDPDLQPVPAGAVGEIVLAGEGVTRGYLGQPGLTAERFVPDPFADEPGGRLYRTGDLARFREDGQLDFLGRSDHQVKIRGFRIELGEIQARLEAHPGVLEAAVLARDHRQRGKYLTAFVVPKPGATVAPEELTVWVRAVVPTHMAPTSWHVLEILPRTPNGKLDRRRLPADSDAGKIAAGDAPVRAELDPTEEIVRGIWTEVLGVAEVKCEDNFFDLGGHSLLATQVIARVRSACQVECPLHLLFDHPTASAFARRIRELGALAEAPAPAAGAPPVLSFAQQRMWVLWRLEPGSAAYHIPVVLSLRGAMRIDLLQGALAAVVERHAALRTLIGSVDGRPELTVADRADVPLSVETVASAAQAEAAALAEIARPFHLDTGPLLRAKLLELAPDHHWLVLTLHHIAGDGWSLGVLMREVAASYEAEALPALAYAYSDYAAWQRTWLTAGGRERELSYWREQLAGVPALELPTDRPYPEEQSYAGAMECRTLGADQTAAVKSLARRQGATPFMVLLAAWQTWLCRVTGQGDFAIGAPVAGRTRPEFEPLIGLFVNTLCLRANLADDPTFAEALKQVRHTTLAAHAHQAVPFEQVLEVVEPARDPRRPPVFQVMFVLQNTPLGDVALPGLAAEPVTLPTRTAKFELTLGVEERAEGYALSLEYSTALFAASTARRWLDGFVVLLSAALANPKGRIAALPVLTPEDRSRLTQWNATAVTYPADRWVHEFAGAQPAEAVALVAAGRTLTYGEFEQATRSLAARLRHAGVGDESLVAVYLERSVELVVALHAVMRAGSAYVPLDPTYPAERVAYMLADAAAPVVLTSEALWARFPTKGSPRPIWVGAADETGVATESLGRPRVDHGQRAAYMIYTSGSTGRPKGAVNTHAAILNRLQWMQAVMPIGPEDRVLQKTPFSFDVSVWEFFWPMMAGATLVVAEPEAHRDPTRLIDLIVQERVTTVHFVPSMLRAFLNAEGVSRCSSLRRVICSGEELSRDLVDQFHATFAQTELFNLYGPTEAAVDVTWHRCERGETGPVPIGRPIANLETVVADARGQLLPVGVPGELLLGGVGLGRGYHGRPELTAERWVPHPSSTHPGTRLYRTGDRVRWREDGSLEYLGRLDFQVKLRGLRIELGEIECALRDHAAVADAAVVMRTDEVASRLVGYVVGRGDEVDSAQLATWLGQRLPDYMVPTAWVALPALPLSPAGKLDRRALPAPPRGQPSGTTDEAPVGPMETLLAGLWRDLLKVPVVGRTDNFFALGGDSILALQVAARAANAGVQVPAQAVFSHQTLADLALVATASRTDTAGAATAAEGPVGLTPAQHWFFAQGFANAAHWNQSTLLVTPVDFDAARFSTALRTVVARHEVLAQRYDHREGHGVVQPASTDEMVAVEQAPLTDLAAASERAQAGLDLARGPLLRAVIFEPEAGAGEGRLLLVAHHLIIDGVSWRVLLDELARAYAGVTITATSDGWKAWTQALAAEAAQAETMAERDYWSAVPMGESLPRDTDRPDRGYVADESEVVTTLSSDETTALLQAAGVAYRTQINDLLLAALAEALRNWTGRRQHVITLEGHGREAIAGAPDVGETLGWFTTFFPLALEANDADLADWGTLIKAVKEQLRAVPRRGLGYGLLHHLGVPAGEPLPELVFNYLGQLDAAPAVTGFRAAHEPRGSDRAANNARPFLIELNAAVTAGHLRCNWAYSAAHHRAETIAQLATAFDTALRAIIAHCTSGEAGGFTASDFSAADVSQSDLDKLFDRLQ